jgi:competence protein ComEA
MQVRGIVAARHRDRDVLCIRGMTRRITPLALTLSLLVPALAPARAGAAPVRIVALLAPPLEGKLNVNTATAAQWDLLPGIGPATAAKILEHRSKKPFRDISQLMRVDGIGRKTFDAIKRFLVVEGETTLRVASPQDGAS